MCIRDSLYIVHNITLSLLVSVSDIRDFLSSFSGAEPVVSSGSMSIDIPDFLLSAASFSNLILFFSSFMKKAKIRPTMNIPKQKASPPRDYDFDSPLTIRVKQTPKMNPAKFPIANNMPVAVPSATGKAISQPNSSMMGTSGIKKNELNAETRLARARILV